MKENIKKIFDDLDDYKRFCTVFGHPYDEADLYRDSSPVYAEYAAFKSGKRISSNWIKDAKVFGRNIFGSK